MSIKESKFIPMLFLSVLIGLDGLLLFPHRTAIGERLLTMFRGHDESIQNVFKRSALEREGMRLAKRGELDLALAKYREAIRPQYINYEYQKSGAIGAMIEIYKWKKEYGKAMELLAWFFNNSATGEPTEKAKEEKREIEALIEYEWSEDPQKIYDVIEDLRRKYRDFLPPVSYSLSSVITISNILRLYDTIGDYDAGIAYIDEILDWTFEDDDEFKHLKGKIRTVQDAEECMAIGPAENPDWHACKWLREYLLVREAFEAEKRAGGPTCKGQPDCIGDATRALIQSDYFPW